MVLPISDASVRACQYYILYYTYRLWLAGSHRSIPVCWDYVSHTTSLRNKLSPQIGAFYFPITDEAHSSVGITEINSASRETCCSEGRHQFLLYGINITLSGKTIFMRSARIHDWNPFSHTSS